MFISDAGPFLCIRWGEREEVLVLSGAVQELDLLDDIPVAPGGGRSSRRYNTVAVIPYAQIKERGYQVRDDGCKIICMQVEKEESISLNKFIPRLPDEEVSLDGDISYTTTDAEYKRIIQQIITKEIGNGEGANFVIPRTGIMQIAAFSHTKVLSIFRRLLHYEIGAYATFLFFDGQRYFVGASPEKHVSVHNTNVKMNPISGTFRKRASYPSIDTFKQDVLTFLHDEKEINELFMVVDEELKMMAKICSQGGMIIGPLLKEMAKLIHTEYLLSGVSDSSLVDILRESMFAATLMGGPLENAAQIIHTYEPEGRRYYAGALAFFGQDEGEPFLDSPIMLRALEIDTKGRAIFRVGTTLVRDSNPEDELEETHAKMRGVLKSFLDLPVEPVRLLDTLRNDEDIAETLQLRNQRLSLFWFFNQAGRTTFVPELRGKKVVIMDNEDDFCYMQKHMLTRMGMDVSVVRYTEMSVSVWKDADLVIVGPGTGNPNNIKSPKMRKITKTIQELRNAEKPFLCICLGHQVLCRVLGISVERKDKTFQGVPREISLFGTSEIVGFYNTFAGMFAEVSADRREELDISYDSESKEIYALRSKKEPFVSLQFHPESILTQHGYDILKESLLRIG